MKDWSTNNAFLISKNVDYYTIAVEQETTPSKIIF